MGQMKRGTSQLGEGLGGRTWGRAVFLGCWSC